LLLFRFSSKTGNGTETQLGSSKENKQPNSTVAEGGEHTISVEVTVEPV